jgi:DNA-binding beta-propeller fold protein YncE
MKNPSLSRFRSVAGTALLTALLSVCQLSAATNPLNQPRGLALASNGNLYVANSGGNNVLVFNPNYAWVSSKTITAGVDKPTGVAFDSAGNLYVANIGTESVTQYSSAGVQNTAGTITAAINTPEYIAVDGLDNIWVNDGNIEVTIYAANVYPANTGGPATYQNIFVPPSTAPIYGIALHNQYFAWGSVNEVVTQHADQALGSAGAGSLAISADETLAVAFDSAGNLYYANADNSVDFLNFNLGITIFKTLSFTPAGMVVDSTRGRVYVSNQQGNAIEVYSTANGLLLKTIQ